MSLNQTSEAAPIALITGSAGGIGHALVSRFLMAGYQVIGLDISQQVCEPGLEFVAVDLYRFCQDSDYRKNMVEKVENLLPNGRISVLINNAALQVVGPVETFSLESWQRVMTINVTAPFALTQSFLPQLVAARGSIINVSSIHAQLTKPGFTAYASSKAALTGLTKALAVELGGRIRVNAIAPAAINTEMLRDGFAAQPAKLQELRDFHPVGTIGDPDEVADIALMLASGKFTFLNGAVIQLDGGISSRLHDPV